MHGCGRWGGIASFDCTFSLELRSALFGRAGYVSVHGRGVGGGGYIEGRGGVYRGERGRV